MEWIIGPMLIGFYGCSFLYAVLRLFEKEQPAVTVSHHELMARRYAAIVAATRRAAERSRQKEEGIFDWKKEGF